jgi:hypothetical protein
MEDFANHYHTTVIPARARKPKDKALVENQVKMIYTRVYARLRNQQFFDLIPLSLSPVRQPYFSQAMENRVFSELDWLFGKIAVKIELIAK